MEKITFEEMEKIQGGKQEQDAWESGVCYGYLSLMLKTGNEDLIDYFWNVC